MAIDKKEINYIFYAALFAFVWMVFIIPNYMNSSMMSNPLIAYAFFNLGVFFMIQIVFKGLVMGGSVKFSEVTGLLMVANAVDLLAPPYIVNSLGQLSNAVTLANSSTDYIIATLWQNIGINGFLLYIFTYVISPVLLLIFAGLTLKNFVRRL